MFSFDHSHYQSRSVSGLPPLTYKKETIVIHTFSFQHGQQRVHKEEIDNVAIALSL